jgi:enoyl-CoA hydratase/carnithine racemase
MSLDMHFAAKGRAVLGMFEVALGSIPGAGGTQRLPRLIGRARALEVIIGCDEFDADTAVAYGWINRALPPDELHVFVNELAQRIASFPLVCIRESKIAVDAAALPFNEGIQIEHEAQRRVSSITNAKTRMQQFLNLGGQQAAFELHKMRQSLMELESQE